MSCRQKIIHKIYMKSEISPHFFLSSDFLPKIFSNPSLNFHSTGRCFSRIFSMGRSKIKGSYKRCIYNLTAKPILSVFNRRTNVFWVLAIQ